MSQKRELHLTDEELSVGTPGIWGTQSVVRVKGEKSNRRSLGFARDDSFLDWMVCGVADPYIPSTFS